MGNSEIGEKINGTPELGGQLHWSNSSNVLCKYMSQIEYLAEILKNQAIIPRYVIEPLGYLNIKNLKQICFPMICFCDIPLSKVSTHMFRYGEFGIGLDKESVIKKYRIQPVHYMNPDSPLTEDFRSAFLPFYHSGENLTGNSSLLADYLLSTLLYMKPIWLPQATDDGTVSDYVFQDECEWRFIPSDNFPENLHLILPNQETTEHGKQTYSTALVNHPECWLHFDWSEVKYIIVSDEAAAKKIIETIRSIDLDDTEKDMLITKIEISRSFSDNM